MILLSLALIIYRIETVKKDFVFPLEMFYRN